MSAKIRKIYFLKRITFSYLNFIFNYCTRCSVWYLLLPPVCSAGETVQERPHYLDSNVVIVFFYVPCDGYIQTWDFWTRQPGKLRAMIVRSVPESPSEFTIVGINDITITSAMTNQKITYTVPSDERIIAQTGDRIAVGAFDGTNNPRLQTTNSSGVYFKYGRLDPTTLNPGMTFIARRNYEASFSLSLTTSPE